MLNVSDRDKEMIAAACHCAARAMAFGEQKFDTHPWEIATNLVKDDTREAVNLVLEGGTAEDLHKRWIEKMTTAGYTYGEEHDQVKRKHPNLVPWDELLGEVQLKTVMFVENVQTMLRVINEPIDLRSSDTASQR